MFRTLSICLLLIALSGCERASPPELNIQATDGETHYVPSFVWNVRNPRELERLYRLYGGEPLGEGKRLSGFLTQSEDETYYIFTLPVTHLDDEATTTLGHEVLHIVLGKYHD